MPDELSAALHELAATRATPPVVPGPGIRARAMRRRRRRRTAYTLGAGTAALALLGLALTLLPAGNPDQPPGHRSPALASPDDATPSVTSPVPVSGTLDLPGRTLTLDGRALPIVSASDASLGSTSSLTVVAKQNPTDLTIDVPSKASAVVSFPYVVELRDEEGGPHYVGLFAPRLKGLSDFRVRGDWIGLGAKDAQWFYTRIDLGDTLSVTADAG
ncbi:hypothetical protein I2W78_17845 [Streptomyces spinoverrucosus]|uniref:hypothetical protein n=1 Tax=Streptomyces spinoverrucosus TaxID=284043 RepID=UPI0018C3D5B6|nr:hypothetical protein [Streptomyces spinoverrucosus]MBG0853659.1 hypothetical protein [Streptomyces spinoverrucosus]